MIAVDTNLLVYAHREDADFHGESHSAIQDLAESGQRWAIPWPCLHEFLAIVTHPRIYRPATPMNTAVEAMRVWVESPTCETIGEEAGYLEALSTILKGAKVVGPAVHDARIATLCIHHGVQVLWTADRDFSRFGALRTHNPLAAA